jgi:hypothetical protein
MLALRDDFDRLIDRGERRVAIRRVLTEQRDGLAVPLY